MVEGGLRGRATLPISPALHAYLPADVQNGVNAQPLQLQNRACGDDFSGLSTCFQYKGPLESLSDTPTAGLLKSWGLKTMPTSPSWL